MILLVCILVGGTVVFKRYGREQLPLTGRRRGWGQRTTGMDFRLMTMIALLPRRSGAPGLPFHRVCTSIHHHSLPTSSFPTPLSLFSLLSRIQTPIATGVLLGCTAMFSQIQLLLFTIFEARR
jgi:hypothetical protein